MLPPNGTDPKERMEPFVPSKVTVAGSPLGINVPYALQWAVNVSWNASRGSVVAVGPAGGSGPPPAWWNASQRLTLQASALPDFAFNGWTG